MAVTALLVLQTNTKTATIWWWWWCSTKDAPVMMVCDNPHIFVTDLIFQVGEDELHQDTESVMDVIW